MHFSKASHSQMLSRTYNYRVRLLFDIIRAVGPPVFLLYLFLRYKGKHIHLSFLHISAIVFWNVGRNRLKRFAQAQECKRLGAKPIPCVVGNWPGNVDILLKMMRAPNTRYILDVYIDLFEEYKCTTLNLNILWVDHIITMDAEHSKFVISTGFRHFWRGHAQKERMETLLGKGIFNRDDEEWRTHRAMARPFFTRERISDFETFERYTDHALDILSNLSASGQPCEVQDLYSRFTLDAASEFLLGRNLDTLSAVIPTSSDVASLDAGNAGPRGSATLDDVWGSFMGAFENAQHIIVIRGRIGYFWPLFELFGDKSAPHVHVIQGWLDPIVREVVDECASEEKLHGRSNEDKSFLHHLAASTKDKTLIRDQLLNMLLASRDTTACLLTFVTYFMAIHPEVAKEMRAEVLKHFGPHGTPAYQTIRNLKYMRAVINETLRLFPPVPLNVRESRPTACTLPPPDSSFDLNSPQPFYMPGNTVIMYLPLLTQRSPKLWGPDADTFDPSRWLRADGAGRSISDSMAFAPFSIGPRICLGQNYAYAEASYFLVRLLQRFDTFTLATDVQPRSSLPPSEWKNGRGRQRIEQVWPALSLTLFIKGGLWVRFSKS